MKLSWKIEDLEILNQLDRPEKEEVLKESNAGRHFLSVYFSSLILPLSSFGIIAFLKTRHYLDKGFDLFALLLIALTIGCCFQTIEVNLLNRKAIKDIIKTRSNKAEPATSESKAAASQ